MDQISLFFQIETENFEIIRSFLFLPFYEMLTCGPFQRKLLKNV